MRELATDELQLVAGGFGYDPDDPSEGDPPPEPEREEENRIEEENPWWNESDTTNAFAALGALLGGFATRSSAGAAGGAIAGGWIGNRIGDVPPGEDPCPGTGMENPCGPVAIK